MTAVDTVVARFWELMRKNYEPLGFSIVRTYRMEEWDGLMTTVRMEWKLQCPCGAQETAYSRVMLTDEMCADAMNVASLLEEIARDLADNALRLTAGREHLEEDVARGTLPASVLEGAVYSGRLLT